MGLSEAMTIRRIMNIPETADNAATQPAILLAWPRRRRRFRRGAALIEMVIGFTVLIVMIFGVIEAALFYQDHELLNNITREAARRMSVGDTAGTTGTAIPKALQWNMGNSAFTVNTVGFTIDQPADGLNSGWSPPLQNNQQATNRKWVRVQTTYTHRSVTRFFGPSYILHATAIVRVENGAN